MKKITQCIFGTIVATSLLVGTTGCDLSSTEETTKTDAKATATSNMEASQPAAEVIVAPVHKHKAGICYYDDKQYEVKDCPLRGEVTPVKGDNGEKRLTGDEARKEAQRQSAIQKASKQELLESAQ